MSALNGHDATVGDHRALHHRQTEASPVRLGRKERIEDPAQLILCDPLAVIANLDKCACRVLLENYLGTSAGVRLIQQHFRHTQCPG